MGKPGAARANNSNDDQIAKRRDVNNSWLELLHLMEDTLLRRGEAAALLTRTH